MSYLALYRKWRPRLFSEVVGQPHVTRTIGNALLRDRVAHAYLFCGPRGTGKTTTAKLFAQALNCRARSGSEPCGACPSCASIREGSSLDVLEIDAASNRGIDEIRDLREKARFTPTEGRFKVYIVDEVHMLTPEAFNALLKTLEEPPGHVIFILATTEPHRLPATILSRCQRFDFRPLSVDLLTGRLRFLAERENLEIEEEALLQLARRAAGSSRDAESLLDQCMASAGKHLTEDSVLSLLGGIPAEELRGLAGLILDKDASGVLHRLRGLASQGKDLPLVLHDLLSFFKDLLVLKLCPGQVDLVVRSREDQALMQQQAGGHPEGRLWELAAGIKDLIADLRFSTMPQIQLEIGLLGLCGGRDQALESRAWRDSLAAVVSRVEALEQVMGKERGAPPPAAAPEKTDHRRTDQFATATETAAAVEPAEADKPASVAGPAQAAPPATFFKPLTDVVPVSAAPPAEIFEPSSPVVTPPADAITETARRKDPRPKWGMVIARGSAKSGAFGKLLLGINPAALNGTELLLEGDALENILADRGYRSSLEAIAAEVYGMPLTIKKASDSKVPASEVPASDVPVSDAPAALAPGAPRGSSPSPSRPGLQESGAPAVSRPVRPVADRTRNDGPAAKTGTGKDGTFGEPPVPAASGTGAEDAIRRVMDLFDGREVELGPLQRSKKPGSRGFGPGGKGRKSGSRKSGK